MAKRMVVKLDRDFGEVDDVCLDRIQRKAKDSLRSGNPIVLGPGMSVESVDLPGGRNYFLWTLAALAFSAANVAITGYIWTYFQ